jgi:peptide-methionine (S)-S-oxide reductase
MLIINDKVPGGFTMTGDVASDTKGRIAMVTFAGGCFWCMEPPFDAEPGVLKTIVGYTGGSRENPTYEQVSAGRTGHAESIRIDFDPDIVSYERLLEIFWENIDPLDGQGQFCDRGLQYRSAIFYHDNEQKELAEASKERLVENGSLSGEIFTEIVPASTFYPAEEYHQDYYKKKPLRYKFYRYNCGRDRRLKQLWGCP